MTAIPLPVEGYQAWLLRLEVLAGLPQDPSAPWFRCAGGIQTALNALLVDDGRRVTLVDTGRTASPVARELESIGYTPGDVATVVLTQESADRAGGLDAFSHAAVARGTVGIQTESATGIAGGESVVSIDCGTTRLVHLGGVVTHAVQLGECDSPVESDEDPAAAAATRRAVLEELAEAGTLTVGTHLPGPGYVGRTTRGYGWSPILF